MPAKLGARLGVYFAALLAAASPAAAEVYRDFDGDGRSDVLVRERQPIGAPATSNGWQIRYANGTVVDAPPYLSTNAHIVGYGNFDADPATAEILVQVDRTASVLAMSPTMGWIRFFDAVPLDYVDVLAVGDFDGDPGSLDDVLVRDPLTGDMYIYLTATAANPTASVPVVPLSTSAWPSLAVRGVADFNGDGRDDVLWRHQLAAEMDLRLWFMDATNVTLQWRPISWLGAFEPIDFFRMVAGDFDGDGVGDLIFRNTRATGTTGHSTLLRMDSWRDLSETVGPSHDDLILVEPGLFDARAGGDEDGNGTDDLFGSFGSTEVPYYLLTRVDGTATSSELKGTGSYVSGDAVWHRERALTTKRFRTLRDYRNSGSHAHDVAGNNPRWSPEEIVDLLEAYGPGWAIDMGIWTGRPVGHEHHREVGRVVGEAQSRIDSLPISADEKQDMKGRFSFHFRADVFGKYVDGHSTCGDDCGWGGTMTEPAFDDAWMMYVPKAEHRWAIDTIWSGDPDGDPLCETALYEPGVDDCVLNAATWPSYLDRDAIVAGAGPDAAPALYTGVSGDGTPGSPFHPRVAGVVFDLRNPAYRAWAAQRLVANLSVWGIDPGEPAVVNIATKPGLHTYYPGDQPGGSHPFPDSHMWTGPAQPATKSAGPHNLHRTGYGPGEYETAASLFFQDARDALLAAGYPDVRIATSEKPDYIHKWWGMHHSLRTVDWMAGEDLSSCNETNYPSPPGGKFRSPDCPTITYPQP